MTTFDVSPRPTYGTSAAEQSPAARRSDLAADVPNKRWFERLGDGPGRLSTFVTSSTADSEGRFALGYHRRRSWPTKLPPSRSTSSSRRSGPSSPGSVITFDPEKLETRVAALEQELGAPGFWDDPQHAAKVSAEHARLTRRLDRYGRLTQEYQDAQELLAMDGDMANEIEASIAPLRTELDRLQEDALFSGEYDAGDALVTIHAGTGGTDAQDWAEMLLRMYLRWAAGRGFQTDLLEASPGEEAGLKSATFSVRGENAYGILKAERGVHRLVRLSPFDQAHRRHTSFAQVIVAPLLADEGGIEIDETAWRRAWGGHTATGNAHQASSEEGLGSARRNLG